ncbi:MAG: phage integrase N-terminal SAM-like domain-containing protein, partial [Thermofilaceae archaeon]
MLSGGKLREMPNAQLLDLYISHLIARNRSSRTIKSFKSILSRFLSFLGEKHLSDVTLLDVDLFLAELKRRGWEPSS